MTLRVEVWRGSECPPAEASGGARGLHGSRMRTKAALMAEWSLAAGFPPHFGGTWDALRDALADLPEGGTFLVLEADQVLQEAPVRDGRAWSAVLRAVGEDLGPHCLHLILQVEPAGEATLREGLAALGLRTEP